MTFELHVWSPAFELPSIDPQCLATIAYLSYISRQIDPQLQWQIVASNDPSVCPTKSLPALIDTTTGTTIGGLQPIIDHLRTLNPSWDLDRSLPPAKLADLTAFTTHITTRGNILLALSLFVSNENYTTLTRPTYSSFLPWPTQYIIPPALRTKARALTAHLGLSSPDLDDNNDNTEGGSSGGKSIIPDSLRRLGSTSTTTSTSNAKSLTAALAANQTSTRFRLEALVDDFCAPLSTLLSAQDAQRGYLLSTPDSSSLDALCSAYLNLMLAPSAALPQNWLAERIRARWPDLDAYASYTRGKLWDGVDVNSLPISTGRNNGLSRTVGLLMSQHLPSPTTIIPASSSATSAGIADEVEISRSEHQHDAGHSLTTVLLTTTAFAAALAAVSSYLLMPYLSTSAGGQEGRSLGEMGEAGGILSSVMMEVEPTGVSERVEL